MATRPSALKGPAVRLDDGTWLTLRHAEHVMRTLVADPDPDAPKPPEKPAGSWSPYLHECLKLVMAEYDRRAR